MSFLLFKILKVLFKSLSPKILYVSFIISIGFSTFVLFLNICRASLSLGTFSETISKLFFVIIVELKVSSSPI